MSKKPRRGRVPWANVKRVLKNTVRFTEFPFVRPDNRRVVWRGHYAGEGDDTECHGIRICLSALTFLLEGDAGRAQEVQFESDVEFAVEVAEGITEKNRLDFSELSPARKDPLVIMAFDMGPLRLSKMTDLFDCMRRKDWQGASDAIRASEWFKTREMLASMMAASIYTNRHQFSKKEDQVAFVRDNQDEEHAAEDAEDEVLEWR